MVRFFPKEEKFFEYFSEASEQILAGIRLLREMMVDLSTAAESSKKIKEVEHEGDRITHETISKLHQTFITPIDREFIHSLITRMDDILDLIDSASERVFLYKITRSTDHALSLINTMERAITEVAKGVAGLRDLKKSKSILNTCIEIHSLENEGDRIFRLALSDLFNSSFDPTEIIKWKDIYETFEDTIDKCEDVANILEGIVLENA